MHNFFSHKLTFGGKWNKNALSLLLKLTFMSDKGGSYVSMKGCCVVFLRICKGTVSMLSNYERGVKKLFPVDSCL